MPTYINTNIKSLTAANALAINGRTQQTVMESLSTGKRINRASDDAAGLSIRETMTSQIKGLDAAVRNANDSVSLLQTADTALAETSNMMQRMREIAVLAANDTYNTSQKAALGAEFNAMSSQISKIATTTQWNGRDLLTGVGGLAASGTTGSFTFQIGANAGDTLAVILASQTASGYLIDDSTISVTTLVGATAAVTALDTAISGLNTQRSTIGSAVNRLTHAIDNLTSIAQNTSESRSKVEDTDYAAATSDLARTQIIQQAATAILAQANQQPQSVLSLLK